MSQWYQPSEKGAHMAWSHSIANHVEDAVCASMKGEGAAAEIVVANQKRNVLMVNERAYVLPV
jgi:hypothetical protein